MDLYELLQKKTNELDVAIKNIAKTSNDYAESYTNYRIELAKELVRLKDEKMPVTLAYDVARGKREIARLKFDEICKEAIYKANLEAINSTKLEIRILQEQINKEYSND